MRNFDFKKVEQEVTSFWNKNKIYENLKQKNKKGKKYYFLDGPPYTSGRVHLGTAWNKVLKDSLLRYKRMKGFNVWDRAGYDMHGLPTENATMKKLGMKDKDEIKKYGVDKFIQECKKLCTTNLQLMNEDFKKMGVWMDFDNAYQTISKEFMDGIWWLVKKAHEKGRLYEGLRTMTWCPITESSLAKHELEYHTIQDNSIFVKFKLKNKKDEYLVIWTTTPWTIPFNLAVMVGPDIEYVKAKVENETWYVAAALAGVFIQGVANKEFKVLKKIIGEEMQGWEYEHPFYDELKNIYDEIKAESKKSHTILLSEEYVDTSAGSGLVHCAPGCGPEDYEVGYKNGIPAFNNIDTKGIFPKEMGKFAGLKARRDDAKFTEELRKRGALIAETIVEHEYPHDWRHHEPVIFRTTKQWFFKIEDLKPEMIKQNKNIKWVPNAAFNAFDSWLNNIRDNSISKQRYWGTPLPVWRNTKNEEDFIVIGSAAELEKLSGKKVDDLHIPTVDHIEIKKNGKTYKRVPDVLDVWVDAGTTSWTCLDYPKTDKNMKELFPAEFILEGKDQIRGWFNLLMICSMVSMGKPSFKNVYMHGFINDCSGEKMSKSMGNQTSPYEIMNKYGSDTLRYYAISAAKPGLDMNYNTEETEIKYRNLLVLWNMQHLLIDIANSTETKPEKINLLNLQLEDKFILSKLNSSLKKLTKKFDNYELNETPLITEELFLTISRTYIKLIRERSIVGTEKDKQALLNTFFEVYLKTLMMFTPIAPYITEQIYQNLKERFQLEKNSIHEYQWPKHNEKLIDVQLEKDFEVADKTIGAILSCRDQANIGIRWPLQEVVITTSAKQVKKSIQRLKELIISQVNVHKLIFGEVKIKFEIKPNFKSIGKKFGSKTADVAELISKEDGGKLVKEIQTKGKAKIKEFELLWDDLEVKATPPDNYKMSQVQGVTSTDLFLNTNITPELELEGFAREIIRRTQQLRKESKFNKEDTIRLSIKTDLELSKYEKDIKEKVGAKEINIKKDAKKLKHAKEENIRNKKINISIEKLK